jgi:hypothetical protein
VYNFTKESFEKTIAHFNELDSTARMFWVMRPAQVACKNPNGAMTVGLARTVRNELSAKLFTIEMDEETSPSVATAALVDILCWTKSPKAERESMDPDWEFTINKGKILVPRFHWQQMSQAFHQTEGTSDQVCTEKQLTVKTPGLLHTLGWMQVQEQSQSLGSDQVLVTTKATGLNFRVRFSSNSKCRLFYSRPFDIRCTCTLLIFFCQGCVNCSWGFGQ